MQQNKNIKSLSQILLSNCIQNILNIYIWISKTSHHHTDLSVVSLPLLKMVLCSKVLFLMLIDKPDTWINWASSQSCTCKAVRAPVFSKQITLVTHHRGQVWSPNRKMRPAWLRSAPQLVTALCWQLPYLSYKSLIIFFFFFFLASYSCLLSFWTKLREHTSKWIIMKPLAIFPHHPCTPWFRIISLPASLP